MTFWMHTLSTTTKRHRLDRQMRRKKKWEEGMNDKPTSKRYSRMMTLISLWAKNVHFEIIYYSFKAFSRSTISLSKLCRPMTLLSRIRSFCICIVVYVPVLIADTQDKEIRCVCVCLFVCLRLCVCVSFLYETVAVLSLTN